LDVTILHNDPYNPHGYDKKLFTDDGTKFLGSYVSEVLGERFATKHFGKHHEDLVIIPKTLECIISSEMMPPKRPIGIDFYDFEIRPDCLPLDEFNDEIISHFGAMHDRFVIHAETTEDIPIEWLETDINEELVKRHIPLFNHEHGYPMFHAQHLYDFLDHVFKMPFSAAIFGCDS
jgi:hypothetical protein